MSFLDGVTYGKETVFSNERLIALTPEDIMRYFYFETFGIANLIEEEKLRLKRRSSCIEFWKKSIPLFMPNRAIADDEFRKIKFLCFKKSEDQNSRTINDLVQL